MIIADHMPWEKALQRGNPVLTALVDDLWRQGQMTSPGLIWAQLLAGAQDAHQISRVRDWADGAAPLTEPRSAWLAAGDLGLMLHKRGVRLSMPDAYLVTICLREGCPLWSYNPRYGQVAKVVRLERYEPSVQLRR